MPFLGILGRREDPADNLQRQLANANIRDIFGRQYDSYLTAGRIAAPRFPYSGPAPAPSSMNRFSRYAYNLGRNVVRSALSSAGHYAGYHGTRSLLNAIRRWRSRPATAVTRYRRTPGRSIRSVIRGNNRRLRRALNRRRRRIRRRVRNRRRARRHRLNVFTNKREQSTRVIVARPRISRNYYYGLSPRLRARGWYGIGRWSLLGSQSGEVTLTATIDDIWFPGMTQLYSNTVGQIAPALDGVEPMYVPLQFQAGRNIIYAGPHFNIYQGTTTQPAAEPPNPLPSYTPSILSRMVGATTCQFAFSRASEISNYQTWLAQMPPLPSVPITYMVDNNNYFGEAVGNVAPGGGATNFTYNVPYRCFWHRTYVRCNYSFKVTWPEAWANLTNSALQNDPAHTVPPPNPPFYARLIGIKSRTVDVAPTPEQFVRAAFASAAYINDPFQPAARANLRANYSSFIFFDKLWMLNGRMIPQYQSGEVLSDGEESSFVTTIPMSLTNNYQLLDSSSTATKPFWPGTDATGVVIWYLFCAFRLPISQVTTTAATITNFFPDYSAKLSFEYYCYPKMKAPNTFQLVSGTGTAFNGGMALMSSRTVVGTSVEAETHSSAPELEASVSSPSAAQSFSKEDISTSSTSSELAAA